MRKLLKIVAIAAVAIAGIWLLLTVWAESEGPARLMQLGASSSQQTALIVYDADPLYNLDQQICETFGRALADKGWSVTVATVPGTKNIDAATFSLYIFCANTYNWSPDRTIGNFIKRHRLNGKNAIAITLGGGSTSRSKRILEDLINQSEAKLIDSKTFWLWRPNDEKRLKEDNVKVTLDVVKQWAHSTAVKALG